MAAAPKDADVRSVIRSILVSNPNEMTARFLDRDFMEMEGYPIPYNKFGFKSLLDYLRSIPDTVTVKGIAANPVVLPVTTEKSAHVEKLVLKQKRAPSHRMPARRTQNHVSASNNRTRKNGSVSHMPQNGPLAKSLDQLTLPGSTDELNKNDPKKSRLKVNIPCLKRHILSIKKRNDKSLTKARADGSSVRTNTNNSDNPFNRSEIKPKCLQEQVNSFRMKSNYSSYKINESTSQPSQYETNGRKEAAKQGNARNLSMAPLQPHHERAQPTNSAARIPSIFELKFDPIVMEKLRGGASFNGTRNYNDMSHVGHGNPFGGQPLFHSPPNVSFQPSRLIEPRWNHSNFISAKPHANPAAPPPSAQQKPPSSNTSHKDTIDNNNISWAKQISNASICPAGAESSRSPFLYSADSRSDDGSAAENDDDSSWEKKSSASLIPAGGESWKNSHDGRLSRASKSDRSVTSEYDNSPISSKMKENFITLLRRNPDGFFCSELPSLYQTEFNAPFCCQDYGYNSIIQMVSEHPSIFSYTRIDKNGDWLLKPFRGNGRNKSDTSLKRFVPRKIIQNILRILEQFPGGLPMSQFLEKYKEFVNESFDFRHYGDSLEVVMNDLENYVHQRRAGSDILLYEASKLRKTLLESKPLASTPALPNIEMNILHKDLYPDECCNLKDIIPVQKLPEFKKKPHFVEVRVSDLESPDRMWFQLGICYDALDTMMKDLHEFYTHFGSKYVMPELTIQPRQLCACVFGDGINERWHRAIIQSISKDKVNVTVEYIDYGTKFDVPRSILRFLHKDFSKLPCQAIRGRLMHVYPPAGCKDWPLTTNQHLEVLTAERRLMLEVESQHDNFIEGWLVDTNGEEDIVINDELVNSGHASLRKNGIDDKSSGLPIIEPFASELNSPNPSAKSDKTLPLYCSPQFDDTQTSTSQTFKYYDTNTTNTYTDSTTGFYTPNKRTTQLPSSSPPFDYTSGTSTSGFIGSLSPHSETTSLSPHSRHSNSPDIIYYGSADHLNRVPLGTPPLSNTSSKYPLNRSHSTHSSSSLRLSSPSSSSQKSETAGDQSSDMKSIPSLANYSSPPFTLTTTTVTTAPPTSSAAAATAALLELTSKRPPPGFGAGNQPKAPVNNLPFVNNYMPPVENNWNTLGQNAVVNQAQQLMMQQLLPMHSPYLFPNYLGLGLPPVYPMLNNTLVNTMASQLNQAVNFPNHNANTFMTNPMYPQRQNVWFPMSLPHSSSGLNVPVSNSLNTLINQAGFPPPTMKPDQFTAETLFKAEKPGNVDVISASPSPGIEVFSATSTPKNEKTVGVECVRSPLDQQMSNSSTHSDLNISSGSAETVTASNKIPVCSFTEATSLTCIDTDSVCSDWEASETVQKETDFESADSDVDTDVSVKGSASTSSNCPQTSAENPLTNLASKPMSRSARKRQRKSMLKNKEKGLVATLPVIADAALSTTDDVVSSSSVSTVAKDSGKEIDDSAAKSDSKTKNETKDTSKKNKNNKNQQQNSKAQVVVAKQTKAEKLASRSTSLRRPKDKDILLEISQEVSNSNPSVIDQQTSTDEIKNEKLTGDETKNRKSSVEVKNEKSNVDKEKNEKMSVVDEEKNEKSSFSGVKNDKSSADKEKNGKSSSNKEKIEESSVDKVKNKITSSDEVKSGKSSKDDKSNVSKVKNDKSSIVKVNSEKSSIDRVKNDESSVELRNVSESFASSKLGVKDCKSDERANKNSDEKVSSDNFCEKSNPSAISSRPTNSTNKSTETDKKLDNESNSAPKRKNTLDLKRELVKDWKLLDNITKDSIYVSKPVKGNNCKTKEKNPETQCDMIDRIISSVGAHVFNKSEAEMTQSTPKEPVQKKVVNNKTIHIFEYNNQPTVCTDEIITSFSKFTKRLAVSKALDCKQAVKPYFDIMRKNNAQLFKLLDNCKICGITKEGETQIPDKLSVLPLENVSNLLKNLSAVPSVVDSFSDLSEKLNAL